MPIHDLVGERVGGGRYLVESVLGEGARGVLYQAVDRVTGEPVALKALASTLLAGPVARRRALTEYRVVATLRHEHLCKHYDPIDADPNVFLVMELLNGETLRQRLDRFAVAGRSLDIGSVTQLMAQAATALAYMRGKGVAHQSVRSDQLFITSDGNAKLFNVRVMLTVDEDEFCTQETLWKLHYMSPERLYGQRVRKGDRGDQYSLGVVFFEALTGRFPREWPPAGPACPIRDFREDVPDEIARLIARMLASEPERRFASMDELANALLSCARNNDRSNALRAWFSRSWARLRAGGGPG